MKKNKTSLVELLDGYEVPAEHRNERGDPITSKSFFARTLSGSFSSGKRSQNKFFLTLKHGIKMLVYTSTRVFGAFLLTFGVLTAILNLSLAYFGTGEVVFSTLLASFLLTLGGLVLTFFDKPIGIALEDFVLTDYILFEFLCMKRMQKSHAVFKGYPLAVGVGAGVLLAVLSTLLDPLAVISAIGILLFVLLSLASPEFSFLFSILVLPYLDFLPHSTAVLAALLITTLVSFVRKVISGKRVYVFEQYDFFLGMMIIFVLLSGIFVKGMASFESSLILVLGSLGYTLASNLVTNRRLADRVCTAITFSSLPASVYAIVIFIIGLKAGNNTYSADGFYSSSVFGVYLIVSVLFTVSALVEAKYVGERVALLCVLISNAAALGCILNYAAMIALFAGLLVYLIHKLRRFCTPLMLLVFAAAYLVFLLPRALLSGKFVTAVLGRPIREQLSLWLASLDMFRENALLGVGIGTEAFSEELAKNSEITAQNSSNLFLEIACEAGIFALIFFIVLLVIALRHRSIYRAYVRASEVRTVSKTAMIALFALVFSGTVSYIWSESAMCYLFWCVFGFGSATLRIAKREHDDRIIYYNDVVSSETSDVDVQIDGFAPKK